MALYGSYNPQYPAELQTAQAVALGAGAEVDPRSYTIAGLPVVTTTGATPTAIMTFAPVDLTVSRVTVVVNAVKAGGTLGGSYEISGTFRRSGATTTQIGSTNDGGGDEDAGCTVALTMAASGANVVVTGTGTAATTIYWSGVATVRDINYLGA